MGEEKKELILRYGVYWCKKGEYYEALCPECEKALNIAGSTDFFCNECKKVRPLYVGDGIPITRHKAVELLTKAEKPEVKPECEEETKSTGNGIILCKLNDVLCEIDAVKTDIQHLSSAIRENRSSTWNIEAALGEVSRANTAIRGNDDIIKNIEWHIKELSNNNSASIAEHRQMHNIYNKKCRYLTINTYMFIIANIALFALISATGNSTSYTMMVFMILTAFFSWSTFIFLKLKDRLL